MSYLNTVMLIGNLGKNPEVLKTTTLGHFVKFSLATSKKFKDKNGEKQTDTQWHVVYASNRLGTLASSYLKTGDKVFISGELRNREWFDDEGKRHFQTSVYARELKFLSIKPQKRQNAQDELSSNENDYKKTMNNIRETLSEHRINS